MVLAGKRWTAPTSEETKQSRVEKYTDRGETLSVSQLFRRPDISKMRGGALMWASLFKSSTIGLTGGAALSPCFPLHKLREFVRCLPMDVGVECSIGRLLFAWYPHSTGLRK